MQRYSEAGAFADSSLKLYNTLIDYNTLNAASTYPFTRFNNEVIFHNTLLSKSVLYAPAGKTDTTLYKLYKPNDVRKKVFFKANGTNNYSFYGTYNASTLQFGGLATDELYLTRAECSVRQNNVAAAINDLNTLLVKRYQTGTFISITTANADSALTVILEERRKELLFRGTRWMDIRRLNQDGRFAVTLRRILNGQEYILQPNSSAYVFPIPNKVIASSGIEQNLR